MWAAASGRLLGLLVYQGSGQSVLQTPGPFSTGTPYLFHRNTQGPFTSATDPAVYPLTGLET